MGWVDPDPFQFFLKKTQTRLYSLSGRVKSNPLGSGRVGSGRVLAGRAEIAIPSGEMGFAVFFCGGGWVLRGMEWKKDGFVRGRG